MTKKRLKPTLVIIGVLLAILGALRWQGYLGLCPNVEIIEDLTVQDSPVYTQCYLEAYGEIGAPLWAFLEIMIIGSILIFVSERTRRIWIPVTIILTVLGSLLYLGAPAYQDGGLDIALPEITKSIVVDIWAILLGVASFMTILLSEAYGLVIRWRTRHR